MELDEIVLAGRSVRRIGFGAMQLPGPGVMGPPRDHAAAIAVLRRAVDAGVNHIDTAQFYGPDVSNSLIHEALHPYPADLVLVSKVGANRDATGQWLPAQTPHDLRAGVEANLVSLELEQVPVVNLRRHPDSDVDFDEQLDAMVAMREEGLIGAVGLSNITGAQYKHAVDRIGTIACVQNPYNLLERGDGELFAACADDGVPFVPFFPLGSAFAKKPLPARPEVVAVAARLAITPAQALLAWTLLQAPTVLLIPGTSSLAHLDENLATADVDLDPEALTALDSVH